jgi:hypothetical protein
MPTRHLNVICHVKSAIRCTIMTLIQRNRFLNRFLIPDRFDSTGYVFNQFAHLLMIYSL